MAGPSKPPFYVTTPIYYVNDVPHIGHAYCTLACDVLARFKRLDGHPVHFLTGTDEHGQKNEKAASGGRRRPPGLRRPGERELPQPGGGHELLERRLHPHHRAAPHQVLPGDLAPAARTTTRSTWAPIPAGTRCATRPTTARKSWRRTPTAFKRAPSGAEVEWVEEPSYFFKLSEWQDRLLELYETRPDFILPETRRNEMASFVKSGLRDLSISRTTFKWGVPVPDDPDHVMYVWIDALTNYITAVGFPDDAMARPSSATGRPTCTWSARTSCASTRSTGRPS